MNTYHVIGLMSGTSLDGLDIAYCRLTYKNKNWIYNILNAETLAYNAHWIDSLRGAETAGAQELIALDHAFGRYMGEQVQQFILRHNLSPDFISSHGHTIFHQPEKHISLQIGSGAYLAAHAKLPVVCDFRTLDIALGGQGAPLVPIGDELLFSDYDYCLNLGGISNISFNHNGQRIAYDISACNMLLNVLANEAGLAYDEDGNLARSGKLDTKLLEQLNAPLYFTQPYPKSLGKEWVLENSLKTLTESTATIPDKLHTTCHHIAQQIAGSLHPSNQKQRLLATGGGAYNTYLIELLQHYAGTNYSIEVPAPEIVSFKEALVFAFLGVLRWRTENNSLKTVTGASHDSVGGAIYWG
ncbi:anhydro-N-acetylmuramic acid kinase [Pontibacter sp. KCTC 32443]|uniref:anhydro-N-acetylmuramic acid kinase n=1 Tax=Pontibacter TaxID=323449 RepID=UPI00164DB7A1|nr:MULTISPECIES: anhydro-N-acetylmuramic acid kinase [Pontibacter]MBC5774478.1 anhydro-N-acetylmuramic acid kinase [Pontibacter sp. KCTC 32443]